MSISRIPSLHTAPRNYQPVNTLRFASSAQQASTTGISDTSTSSQKAAVNVNVQLKDITAFKADAIIINLYQGVTIPSGGTGAVDQALNMEIQRQIKTQSFKGNLGDVMVLSKGSKRPTEWPIPAEHVIIVGLGPSSADPIHILKTANKAAIREIRQNPLLANVKTAGTLLHCTGIGGFGGKNNVSCAAQAMKESTLEESGTHGAGSLKTLSIMDINATRYQWIQSALNTTQRFTPQKAQKKTTPQRDRSQQKSIPGFLSALWSSCVSAFNSLFQGLKRLWG